MKSIKTKYNELYTTTNIIQAIHKFNKNRKYIKRIKPEFFERLTNSIKKQFINIDKIDFGGYRYKLLKDERPGGKDRELLIPTTKSLILQACFLNLLENEINNKIPMNSYSSRKNRGGHRLSYNIKRFIKSIPQKKNIYCLYFDIHKYYDNIDHKILSDMIHKLFRDKNIIKFCDMIITSHPKGIGLPIGNACSHVFANLYISKILDKVNQNPIACKTAVYMDNWNILSFNKRKLHKLAKEIFLELKKINLSVNKDWQIFKITNERGVKHAGFIVFRNGNMYLYKDSFKRAIKNKKQLGTIDSTPKNARSFLSRIGAFKHIRKLKMFLSGVNLQFVKEFSKLN